MTNTITMVVEPLTPTPEGWAALRMFVPMLPSKRFKRFNKLMQKNNLFPSTACFIEIELVRRRQWWLKQRPLSLSLAAANKILIN
jgi:hypothetical protein